MRKSFYRGIALGGLVLVLAAGAVALVSEPAQADSNRTFPCPFPPCLAPCVLEAEPTLLCFEPGGPPEPSTWGCCCCGSSGKTRYRPL